MLIATLPHIKLAIVIANSEDGHKHGDGYFRPGDRSAADKSALRAVEELIVSNR